MGSIPIENGYATYKIEIPKMVGEAHPTESGK
jgi:hypothetical protein